MEKKDMKTYTVLLVDDEEDVIQVIMKKINWEGLGFSVIGYANNGVKALEMVEEYQPDVVMTDIKMPYMDGMELAHHIKEEFPATKLLIFTGFDEFEYAKEAVHLEVEEYLLKPVNSVELTNVFTQMKIKLDEEISEKKNVQVLQICQANGRSCCDCWDWICLRQYFGPCTVVCKCKRCGFIPRDLWGVKSNQYQRGCAAGGK